MIRREPASVGSRHLGSIRYQWGLAAMRWMLRAIVREDGATAVEYAVIASAIAAVVVSITVALGGHTAGLFRTFLELLLAQ